MQSTGRKVLVIDVGNTKIKGALTENGREFKVVFSEKTKGFNLELLSEFSLCEVAVSSVVPEVSEEIVKRFPEALFVSSRLKLPVEVNYGGKIGADRISNIVGGLDYGDSFIVASFGTATVIDIVSNRRFLGGYIFPGIKTMADSLNVSTAELPNVKVVPSLNPGSSTEECISSGITISSVGALKLVQEKFGYPTVITGGFGKLMVNFVEGIYDGYLTFRGIYRIFEINRGEFPP